MSNRCDSPDIGEFSGEESLAQEVSGRIRPPDNHLRSPSRGSATGGFCLVRAAAAMLEASPLFLRVQYRLFPSVSSPAPFDDGTFPPGHSIW